MQNTMAIWMLNFIKELRYGRIMTLVSFDNVFQQFEKECISLILELSQMELK
jgi:hypothetical protein